MAVLTLDAPAKINLTLDILRRRADGYHDLRMVMQAVSLRDTVTVRTGTGGGVTVDCGDADLPAGPGNIAWRAAEVFFQETGLPNGGVAIALEKRIPAQAGMAGGSADGAAVLRALRALYAPELPETELERMGAVVGSDVPFCVRGGTALAEGRGERLTDLPCLPPCFLAVCKPEFGLSTPALFGRVRVAELRDRPDHAALAAALAAGDLAAAAAQMGNVFEQVLTAEERREIGYIKEAMGRCGALNAVMTGSGPTVFGVFEREDGAAWAAEVLGRRYRQTFLARPLSRPEEAGQGQQV